MHMKKLMFPVVVGTCLFLSIPAFATETDLPLGIPFDEEIEENNSNAEKEPTKATTALIQNQVVLYPGQTNAIVNEKNTEMPVAPYIESDVTMVPLRFLTQDILKATVNWDQATQTITIGTAEKTVLIDLANNTVLDGEALYQSPLPPKETDGYTFVPLRLLAEVFGCTVNYEQETTKITILTPAEEVILPIAEFKQDSAVIAGQQLILHDYSYDPMNLEIINREWKVEKNGKLVALTKDIAKAFSYPEAGLYTVSLRVQNSKSIWSDWISQDIEILENNAPIIKKFDISSNNIYMGEEIDFSYEAENEAWEEITAERYTYTWEDEEGIQQEITEKPRSFWYPGTTKVSLQVQDAYGNWSEPKTLQVRVYNRTRISELAYKFRSVIPGEIYLNHNNINYNLYDTAKITGITHEPVTLLASNNPEKVSGTGILYQDTASGQIRLRYHHRNTTGYKINIWAIAKNTSDHPIQLTVHKKAQVGPWPDVLQVGQQVVVNYLKAKDTIQTVMLEPGQQYVINQGQRALAIDDLVAGLIDVSCSEPLEFTICSVPENDKTPDVSQLVKLDKILTHIRGTFADATINMSVTATGEEIEKIIIGREDAYPGYFLQGIDAMTGTETVNNGNRGVLHNITITAEERVGVMLNPRGTMFKGSLIDFDGNLCLLANSGMLKGSHNGVIIGTLNAGETKTLSYMAPSGSDSPILIMLIPEKDW